MGVNIWEGRKAERVAQALETLARGVTGGIPEGGLPGQVLTKSSENDYEVEWADTQDTMQIHICSASEYNAETGLPTVSNPSDKTFYLVPGGESNNLYIEWIYVNNTWEQFGSATVQVPVTDVQINGTSILDSGVANVELVVESGTGVGSIQTKSFSIEDPIEGLITIVQSATAMGAHAEGADTTASGTGSHAEGAETSAAGDYSHAEGFDTIASAGFQHVFGKYNRSDMSGVIPRKIGGHYVEIVGNGTPELRSNARTLDWEGNEWVSGHISIGTEEDHYTPTYANDLVTKDYVDSLSSHGIATQEEIISIISDYDAQEQPDYVIFETEFSYKGNVTYEFIPSFTAEEVKQMFDKGMRVVVHFKYENSDHYDSIIRIVKENDEDYSYSFMNASIMHGQDVDIILVDAKYF